MLLALVLAGVCSLHGPDHHSLSGGSDADYNSNHAWNAGWRTTECNVQWTSSGEVSFTDDGKDIAKLAPGVKLTVDEETADHSRRVVFTEQSGVLERQYRYDGASHPWDAEAAAWFSDLLVELDHQTGKLASIRFRLLMGAGGPSAVLDDMRDASGNVKQTYVRMLAQSGHLGPAESCRVAELTRDMYADHERADLLSEVAPIVDFTSPACRNSYFGTVKKISSDYERARAVIAAVEHAPPAGPALDTFAVAAVNATRDIASDHEKEHVLVTLASRCTGDDARTAYLATAKTIGSDAERARALTALVREQ